MKQLNSPIRNTAAAVLVGIGISIPAIPQAQEIPEVKVRFAHFPYFDHTQSIIGLEKGWFKEVGIDFDPDPYGIVVQASEASAVFASGRVDVMSASAQLFLPAAKTLPPFKVFFYADIFQGYAIMAQPDANAKSFQEFLSEGKTPDEAFAATMGQLVGTRFAFPTEAAIKGFIDLALRKGGITLADVDFRRSSRRFGQCRAYGSGASRFSSRRGSFADDSTDRRLQTDFDGRRPCRICRTVSRQH